MLETVFGERAFSYAGPAAWNSLPHHIQSDTNTASFKKQLKTFFIHICLLTFLYIELCNAHRTIV